MRVLHCAYFQQLEVGVLQQMTWEQDAAHMLSLRWDSRIYCAGIKEHKNPVVISGLNRCVVDGNKVVSRILSWIRLKIDYVGWVAHYAENYDVVLLRYTLYDPYQRYLIRRLRKNGKTVYLVHHTKEVSELLSGGTIVGLAKSLVEFLLAPLTLRMANGIIAVTREIHEYETRRARIVQSPLIYPNGIIVDGFDSVEKASGAGILFVASRFHPWHGLDVVLAAFERSSSAVVLHLVGELSEDDAARAGRDHRIIMHGKLNRDEIKAVARRCSIALSSFALERNNMSEACPLKVREYLAMGMPVYSGHNDIFPVDFPYYRKGAPDLDEMLEFTKSVSNITPDMVREAATPYIDKKALLQELYKRLVDKEALS